MASNPLQDQRDRLARRADGLERELARIVLDLDEAAIERVAQMALSLGVSREEIEAIFAGAVTRNLETLYRLLAQEAADADGLAEAAVDDLAEAAAGTRIAELSDEAAQVVDDVLAEARDAGWDRDQLTRALKAQLPLTARQNGYVANYERALREGSRRALRYALRDRRFDRRLDRVRPLSEDEIAQMVERYRQRWVQARAALIAQKEVYQAVNAAQDETYRLALQQGTIPTTTRKFWIHQHDAKVREAHLAIPEMNPDGVPVDQAFDSPLGPIRYPHDPEASADNTIACRCLLVFSATLKLG